MVRPGAGEGKRNSLERGGGTCKGELAGRGIWAKVGGMASPSHLLVDGYNVIHAWPELRRLLREDPSGEGARAVLVRDLAPLHDSEHWLVTVVFDGKGSEPALEHPGGKQTFTVVYSPAGLSADALMEQMVRRARDPSAMWVASADSLLREAVRACGGMAMDLEDLQRRVASAGRRQTENVLALRKKPGQSFGAKINLAAWEDKRGGTAGGGNTGSARPV